MYGEDSFFTLTIIGRILVGSISLVLTVICVAVCLKFARGRQWPFRFANAFVLFVLFVWLSPQIYYTCYIFLLDVPWQIVIGAPPTPGELVRLLTFSDRANLSFHGQGLLGWLLMAIALLQPRLSFRRLH